MILPFSFSNLPITKYFFFLPPFLLLKEGGRKEMKEATGMKKKESNKQTNKNNPFKNNSFVFPFKVINLISCIVSHTFTRALCDSTL